MTQCGIRNRIRFGIRFCAPIFLVMFSNEKKLDPKLGPKLGPKEGLKLGLEFGPLPDYGLHDRSYGSTGTDDKGHKRGSAGTGSTGNSGSTGNTGSTGNEVVVK